MRAALLMLCAGALLGAGAVNAPDGQRGRSVRMTQLPRAAAQAIVQRVGEAQVERIVMHDVADMRIYEVHARNGVEAFEFTVSADGAYLCDEVVLRDDREHTIAWEELPPTVRDRLVQYTSPDAVRFLFREDEEANRSTFEVYFLEQGMNVSVRVDQRGELMELERDVLPAGVPEEVMRTVNAQCPDAVIAEAETLTRVLYEINVIEDGVWHELMILPDGEIVHDRVLGEKLATAEEGPAVGE